MSTALIGTKSTTHSAHDSTERDPSDGFIPNIDGVFTGQLRNDSANRSFPVLAGVFYDLDVKIFHTSSTGVTAITVFNSQPRG